VAPLKYEDENLEPGVICISLGPFSMLYYLFWIVLFLDLQSKVTPMSWCIHLITYLLFSSVGSDLFNEQVLVGYYEYQLSLTRFLFPRRFCFLFFFVLFFGNLIFRFCAFFFSFLPCFFNFFRRVISSA